MLPKVIDEKQSAFFGGHNMLDGVVVAKESVHMTKKGRKPSILLKVDFEKAYDIMEWGLLRYIYIWCEG